jgi:hypothetical protein
MNVIPIADCIQQMRLSRLHLAQNHLCTLGRSLRVVTRNRSLKRL